MQPCASRTRILELTKTQNGALIPVVHLDLRISPRIFEKFETVLMGYSGAGGKLIHGKKTEVKNLVTLSL
jgi:hypothetical protein